MGAVIAQAFFASAFVFSILGMGGSQLQPDAILDAELVWHARLLAVVAVLRRKPARLPFHDASS